MSVIASEGVHLGSGRSGAVYRRRDRAGRLVADKVFESRGLTRLVQYAFLGAPNPYAWSEDAVRAAFLRRRIVAPLVRLWFGDALVVAAAHGWAWDEERRAWSLQTELVDGVPAALRHPLNRHGADELRQLRHGILRPLERHLDEAGLDGLAWQAGRGNPVALSNFLRLRGERPRWAWIDLESGVPALFPADPRELVRFYLPRSLRRRRVLYDDVDVERLARYVRARQAALGEAAGEPAVAELLRDVDALGVHQEAWRALPRHRRGIAARRAKGEISAELARWYATRPLRWYARESSRLPPAVRRSLARAVRAVRERLAAVPWRHLPALASGFLLSQRYRYRVARRLVGARIDSWERRGQLLAPEAARLRANLQREESSAYLTDFGMHLAIKPAVKLVELVVCPALFAAGLIGPTALGIALVGGGSIARTLYTGGRLLQCAWLGHEKPWIALAAGMVPVLGNLAFPLQIMYSSTIEDDLLARFLLYDGGAIAGRKLPVWGGPDTLTEHVFNRLPDRLLDVRG